MTIYIVRHGQTEENIRKILQGHMPGTLTAEGREQVSAAAENLAMEGILFSRIVSSDLKRAMDSADIISARLGLLVTPMKALCERDWGEYTGMSLPEAKEKFRRDGKWVFQGDSAETEEGIYLRAAKALEEIKRLYNGENIILVTHGQFARNLLAVQAGCSYHDIPSFSNAEIRKLEL